MLVSWKLSPFRNGAFHWTVSVPGTVLVVKPEPCSVTSSGAGPPCREMHPVSGWGHDVFGPEKPLHWIQMSAGTGGSAAAGPLIASVDPAKPATPKTKPAIIVTV